VNRSRDPSATGRAGQTPDRRRAGQDTADGEPDAGQLAYEAASVPTARQAAGAADRPTDVVMTALRQRLGVDAAAAEAIVSGLRRHGPAQDTFSVYLDLNHWISLSKTRAGRPDGARFQPCLDLLQEAVKSGKVILPLDG
jgi:hypothetical protein